MHKDAGTGRVTTLDGALHLQGDVKAKTRKLTWLADSVALALALALALTQPLALPPA